MKREHWSTWYAGTEAQWQALSSEERERLAFEATQCEVAYPTWEAPVDCLHSGCRYRRGEVTRADLVNGALRGEREYGWLRFCSRERAAQVYRTVRAECRRLNTTDIWQCWQVLVYGAVTE